MSDDSKLFWRRSLPSLLALFFIVPIVWWIADRTPPYTLTDGVPHPDPAHPGDEVDLEWTLKLTRSGCTGYFQRVVIDNSKGVWTFAPMQSSFVNLKPGSYRTHSLNRMTLPRGIAPGMAEVFTVTTYFCNPIHHIWPIVDEQPRLKMMINPNLSPQVGPVGPQGRQGDQGLQGERGHQGLPGTNSKGK